MIQKINANWGKFMQTHGDICELRDGAKTPPGGEGKTWGETSIIERCEIVLVCQN